MHLGYAFMKLDGLLNLGGVVGLWEEAILKVTWESRYRVSSGCVGYIVAIGM